MRFLYDVKAMDAPIRSYRRAKSFTNKRESLRYCSSLREMGYTPELLVSRVLPLTSKPFTFSAQRNFR